MNDILILLYLADLVSAFGALLAISGVALLLIYFFLFLGSTDDLFNRPSATKLLVPGILCITLACAMPSKQLLWMAAGIKTTQSIIETPIAQKAVKLLEKELDKALTK